MEEMLNKTHKITAYNIIYGEEIIAGADCYLSGSADRNYIIEIVPYGDQAEKAGVRLTEEGEWKDFVDSEESGEDKPVMERIGQMLSTILKDHDLLKEAIEIRKRKDVFELSIEKNGRYRDLVMVYEFEPFVNSDEIFHPALFIHDMEEFDTWQFEPDTSEEMIYSVIFPAVKSVRSRKVIQAL